MKLYVLGGRGKAKLSTVCQDKGQLGLKNPCSSGAVIPCFIVMEVPEPGVPWQSDFNGVTIAGVKHFIRNQVYIILLFRDLACNAVQIL